jgi:uncharacterized protein (TIGR03085 family)
VSIASAERAALIDLLEGLGPEAPTLCEGWQTRQLAAHLLVRERRPDAGTGILIKPLSGLTDRAMRRYAAKPWPELLGLLRDGPPPWSPFRLDAISERANVAEFFVHHEDVRRGGPGWQPREPQAQRDAALWKVARRMARLLYRNSPVGVVLRLPSGAEHTARRSPEGAEDTARRSPEGAEHTTRRQPRTVVIVGEPGELLLHAFGRDAVHVQFEGDPADVAALAGSRRGL